MTFKVAEIVKIAFRIMNLAVPVTGLVNSDFDKFLFKDGALSAVPVVVTEISDGFYSVEFTPDSTGYWTVNITRTSSGSIFSVSGKAENNDLDDIAPLTPSGSSPLVITVENVSLIPMPGVLIQIWNDSLASIIGAMVTDANGEVITSIPDGSYKVFAIKDMHEFSLSPHSIVASGSLIGIAFIGTEQFIKTSSSPSKCKVYGYLKDIAGCPIANAAVSVERKGTPITSNGDGIANFNIEVSTNRFGFFEVELVRGVAVRMIIQNFGWEKTFTVPDSSNQDFFSIV